MKVERNITLALSEAGKPPQLIKERLTEALAKVHLTGLANRYPSELSGGQQQRVAVARDRRRTPSCSWTSPYPIWMRNSGRRCAPN